MIADVPMKAHGPRYPIHLDPLRPHCRSSESQPLEPRPQGHDRGPRDACKQRFTRRPRAGASRDAANVPEPLVKPHNSEPLLTADDQHGIAASLWPPPCVQWSAPVGSTYREPGTDPSPKGA